MKTKTKEEMKDKAWKTYKDIYDPARKAYDAIVKPATKAYKDIVEPASKTYQEECNRIKELPGPNPEEEIQVKGYRYKLIK